MRRVVPILITAALVAVTVGVLLVTTLVDGSERLPGGSYLRLTPDDDEFTEFPGDFADFAIYWVGEEFGGHELRRIIRADREGGLRPEDRVTFIYGTCVIEPSADGTIDGGCPPPLQIIIEPYCLVPPELIGHGTRPSGIEPVRGRADALSSGGGIRIWTGDVTIKVYAAPGLMEETIAALESPNGLGASAGEDLPPPAAACPPYAEPTLPGG